MAEGGGEKAGGSTPDVFISYASLDTAIAETVCKTLEKAGVTCWFAPRDVTPGAFYADEIVHAIDASKAIVLILSQNAVSSPHVLREVERAASKRHAVISLRIDKAPLPAGLEYFLNTSQWLDASPGDRVRALPKLVSAVQVAIQAPAVTPTGVPVGHAPLAAVSARSAKRLALVVASIVSLALVGFAADRLWLSSHRAAATPATTRVASSTVPATTAPTIPEKSVAVLPFVDMSQKKDQEYFSDGLSDELIDRLAHSPDLKVIARTSSFQFKGSKDDVRTIGQKLGVANVLEGSVRTSGKTLRVTAQLINASDGSHRWSETYDRDIGDVFKVQDSIAAAVVTALKAAIAASTSPPYQPKSTDAYNAYLRGDYFLRKHNAQDTERALASFEEAVRLDSHYADAWVGVGYVYNERGLRGWMPSKEAYAEARKAIDHALSIDPNSAAAYMVVANLEQNFTFDFEKGRAALKRARELDPTSVEDSDIELWDALAAGRFEESIALSRQVVQRNPLSGSRLEDLAVALWFANRLPEAESTFRHLLELDSSFAGAHCELGQILLSERRPDAALAMMSEEANQDSKWCVTDALWALGRRTDADAFLAEARAKHADTQALPIAQSYALRGDKDEAFKWLNRAYDNRESFLYMVRQDPMLGNLRDDPRFAAFVQKMNLPK
jgi:adenylate cyclase